MANFPPELILSATTIESFDDIIQTENLNGIRFTRSRNNQRWIFSLEFALSPKVETWKSAFAQAVQFNMGVSPTTIIHPLYRATGGIAVAPFTSAAFIHSSGTTSIQVAGLPASQNILLRIGDVVRFASSTKVYVITDHLNSNVAGGGTLSIFPPLRKALPATTTVLFNNVEFTMTQQDGVSVSINAPSTATFTTATYRELLD